MNVRDSVSIVMSKISEFVALGNFVGVSSNRSEALGIFDSMCWLMFNPKLVMARFANDSVSRKMHGFLFVP